MVKLKHSFKYALQGEAMKKLLICFLSVVVLYACSQEEDVDIMMMDDAFILYTHETLIEGNVIFNHLEDHTHEFHVPLISNKPIDEVYTLQAITQTSDTIHAKVLEHQGCQWVYQDYYVLEMVITFDLKGNQEDLVFESLVIELEADYQYYLVTIPFLITMAYDNTLADYLPFFALLEWHDYGPSVDFPEFEFTAKPKGDGTLHSITTGSLDIISSLRIGISDNTDYNDRPYESALTINQTDNLNITFQTNHNLFIEITYTPKSPYSAIRYFPVLLDITVGDTNYTILYKNVTIQFDARSEIQTFLDSNTMNQTIYY